MKKEWLQAYEREEQETAQKLGKEWLAQQSTDTKKMYVDKVSFKDTYAYEMGVPLSLLLPFYDQVVTHLLVPDSPATFEYDREMNVETMASLYKRRRLIPIVSYPTYYEGLDYLDPLLELKPPTLVRQDAICKLLVIRRGYSWQKTLEFNAEAKKRILGRFGQLANEFYKKNVVIDQESIESSLINHYVGLKCLGFDEIADKILLINEDRRMFIESFTCAMILAKPVIESAGGWPQAHEILLSRAKEIGLKPNHGHIFPTEAGTVLTKEYGLDSILSPDESIMDNLYTDRAISKARNLLSELSSAVKAKDEEKLTAESARIREVFGEARVSVDSISKSADSIGKIQKISGLVAIGAVGWFFAGPYGLGAGLIAAILKELGVSLAADAAEKASSAICEPLLKLGFGPLPVSIWKFEREIDKIKLKVPPTLSRR